MKKQPIATIINFCTNESRFLKNSLEEALSFSTQVIVPVCDHFFCGTEENRPLLEEIYRAFPDVLFVEYPFIPNEIPKSIFKKVNPAPFWHSLSRLIATSYLKEEVESVLFLDADEIPDGGRFTEWLESSDYTLHTALKLSNYWYFREPCNRALKWEDSIVLAKRKALYPKLLLSTKERDEIYDSLPGPKRRMVVGVNGTPMFHHYSWVRTQEEMLTKVRAWSHKHDRDWESLVKKEFEAPFKGTDFIHNYPFETVQPAFDIHLLPALFSPKGKPNVIRVSSDELLEVVDLVKDSFWKTVFSFFRKIDVSKR